MTDRDALEDIRNTLAQYKSGRLSLPDALEDMQTILEAVRRPRRPEGQRRQLRA